MLAVQESNFLFSFALSGLSALATAFTVLMQGHYTEFEIYLISLSLFYGILGTVIAVFVYGRKVDP